jgi:iron complex transport system substrate-binding protein
MGFFVVSSVPLVVSGRRGSVQSFFPIAAAKLQTSARALAILTSLLFFIAQSVSAQDQPPASSSKAMQPSSSSTTPPYREVTDETGRTMHIPQSVHRIVSLAPSLTETLYALGLGDLLVGDTDYCDYPPDAQTKPRVGGVINPSLEAIAALHPDLVVATKTMNRRETVQALADLGIPSYATDPHTIADIFASTQRLGDLLGASSTAAAEIKDLERRLSDMQQHLAPYPPRRVLFVVWPQPLISIGKNTFIADALLRAGAVSIIDSTQDWPQISLEEVVHRQPDFLIFVESHSHAPPPELASLADLPGWRILDAVKLRHYVVVSDLVDRPAVRIVFAIEDLAKRLHPEAFSEDSDRSKDKSSNQHKSIDEHVPPSNVTISLSPVAQGFGGARPAECLGAAFCAAFAPSSQERACSL